MMTLSKKSIPDIPVLPEIVIPQNAIFSLPEKVLQFGTGVLLRGLPDFMISKANDEAGFNGRIVVVKSTSNGATDSFDEQDGLYTVCIRGIDDGNKIANNHIVSSISRVLSASSQWEEILQCASNPDMQIIISNTTELGIVLTKDNVHASPPQSFPGKLLAFLYQRFKIFEADITKGMVIIPTELIPANADKLLSIVLELAHQNGLEIAFIDWLENANYFCNSLVDRIVPGKFNKEEQADMEASLGYTDDLMIMSEPYALWAIQSGNEKVRNILSFAEANRGVVISPDINKFRELKLRLLNGSHTFTCGLAVLAGFDTVKDAMANNDFALFISNLMNEAIIPSITGEMISEEEAKQFAEKVLDRYRNPFIEHHWSAICTQYSSKMNMRNAALLQQFAELFEQPSQFMSLGMAAHILYMRCKNEDGKFFGTIGENKYLVTDENAVTYSNAWESDQLSNTVNILLSNKTIWQVNLISLNGFSEQVLYWLQILMNEGAFFAMQQAVLQNPILANEK
jgi:tagaturonate reductase